MTAETFHADGQSDMTKLIVCRFPQFCECAWKVEKYHHSPLQYHYSPLRKQKPEPLQVTEFKIYVPRYLPPLYQPLSTLQIATVYT